MLYNHGRYYLCGEHKIAGLLGNTAQVGVQAVAEGRFVRRDFVPGQMARGMTICLDDDGKSFLWPTAGICARLTSPRPGLQLCSSAGPA